MLARRIVWIVPLLLQGCYEHRPRTGPLADLADSVVASRPLRCVGSDDLLLPGQPQFHTCLVDQDSASFFYIGRTGRVLSVVRNWPAESTEATARTLRMMTDRFGVPTYAGDDTHGNTVHNWRMDSLCVSVHEPLREPYVQFDVSLPEFFAHKCP
jgi:hypothetical protein